MTFRILSLLAVALLFHSCMLSKEGDIIAQDNVIESFVAGFIPETKTALSNGKKVSWEEGDRVWYFSGAPSSTASTLKSFDIAASGSSAELTLSRALEDTWFNAVYMGGAEASVSSMRESSYVFNGVSDTQDGSFRNANVCVASFKSGSATAVFTNVTALLKFTLNKRESRKLRKVVFTGLSDEILAGSVAVNTSTGAPKLTYESGGKTSITLSIGGLGTYYINVIPQLLSKGFRMTLYDSDGVERYTVTGSKPLTLDGGVIMDLGTVDEKLEAAITEATLFTDDNWSKCTTILEEYLECRATDDKAAVVAYADKLLSTQKTDGSWPDINYGDTGIATWSPITHAGNYRDLARAWYMTGEAKYLQACSKALSYWMNRNPYSDNWWFNEIGVQRVFAPTFLLLRDQLTSGELGYAETILSKTQLGMTAQNKLWAAGITLQRGLLKHDVEMVKAAYDDITEELCLTTDEGIQPDYSFHQHGKIMQTGVYGLTFAHDYSWWIHAFDGTTLQISKSKRKILEDFMLNGQTWLLRGGMYDLNACGRQVGEGTQKDKASTVMEILSQMGLENNNPVGARYYEYSDFGVYRAKNWYASVRMQSNNLKGWECTNQENSQGYFSSDGALLVRRSGSEYKDVGVCWNWKHIPGATTYDDGKALWGYTTDPPYNKTDLVFGKVIGDSVMVAAMDYVRDGLTARKAWFFYPRGIVCLGAGISLNKDYEVTTTLEQSLSDSMTTGTDYASNAGITYCLLDGGTLTCLEETRTSSWDCICPSYSSTPVTKKIFDLTISHGSRPRGATYAYVVSPEGMNAADAVVKIKSEVQILSNTKALQSVTIAGKTYTVDWSRGGIY